MSSAIELLSINELNIRRENLIQLLKKVDCEIEKKKKILLITNKNTSADPFPEFVDIPKSLHGTEEKNIDLPKNLIKKQIKIKINLVKSKNK
jgi:hypothetical protein